MTLTENIKKWWDKNPQGYGSNLKSIHSKFNSEDKKDFLDFLYVSRQFN